MSAVQNVEFYRPPYSQLCREVAFEIYWTVADQSLIETARVLESDVNWRVAAGLKDGDSLPDIATLTRWKRIDYWPVKIRQKLFDVAPHASAAAAYRLIALQATAAEKLEEIVDKGTNQDKTQLEAIKFVLEPVMANLVELSKPATKETIDTTKIVTMQQALEAEQRLRELDQG